MERGTTDKSFLCCLKSYELDHNEHLTALRTELITSWVVFLKVELEVIEYISQE